MRTNSTGRVSSRSRRPWRSCPHPRQFLQYWMRADAAGDPTDCDTLRRAFFGSGSPQDVLLSSEELPDYHVLPRSRPPAPPPSLPLILSSFLLSSLELSDTQVYEP